MNLSYRICFRYLPTLVGALCLMLIITASVARGQGLEEVNSGELLLRPVAGGEYRPALLHESSVHFDVNGMIASVRLEQRFVNDSNDWLEGVYAFPLPSEAAVRGMEMLIGERRIVGRIEEKQQAKKIYQQAKQAGKKASLVEQQRPNLFTNRVANIGPGETITVRLEYVQEVEYLQGRFSLRFPMTITPRYIPGEPLQELLEADKSLELNPYLGWASGTDQVPDAAAITPALHGRAGADEAPLNPIAISANLDMGLPLAQVVSRYHQVALHKEGTRYRLALANGRVEMNRDFLLEWQAATGTSPEAALFTEEVAGEHYGLLMLVPPAVQSSAAPIARELVFVIDTSGSMGGESIRQAREALNTALQQLRPEDFFNIVEFNSSHRLLFQQPVAATRHHRQVALEFVRQLQAGGGTEMLPALQAALRPNDDEQAPGLRQVVFITDGAVGNEAQLFEQISRRLADQRLFTVGIGSAPNSWFMRKAAEFGRGSHVHIGDTAEVKQRMQELFERIAAPLAVDIQVQWPDQVEAWPAQVPDLYAGEPVVLAAHFPGGIPSGEVLVTGQLQGSTWTRRLGLDRAAQGAPDHPGVASIWARRKIGALLDSRVTGASETDVREAVLPVALEHSLASPYTSFVAVEEKISRPGDSALVKKSAPNTRPAGQSPQPFAYAATASAAPLHTWLGCLALFIALMVYSMGRREPDHVAA